MRNAEYPGKRIFFLGDYDKMNMIAHQTVGDNLQIKLSAIICYKREILFSIAVIIEYVLLVVASLGNVMGISRHY